MQPYEVLGVAGMLFAIGGTILQLIGSKDTVPIRVAGGMLFFGLGLLFSILARERALAIFPQAEFPISLARCYAVIMVTIWVAILPYMVRRVFRAIAWCALALWTALAVLIFFFE